MMYSLPAAALLLGFVAGFLVGRKNVHLLQSALGQAKAEIASLRARL